MVTIYKYTLSPGISEQEIEMPECSEILSVQVQNNQLCVWAKVYPEYGKRPYKFYVYGTGHEIKQFTSIKSSGYCFLGTVQLFDGGIVLHIFYKIPDRG